MDSGELEYNEHISIGAEICILFFHFQGDFCMLRTQGIEKEYLLGGEAR